MEKIPTLFVRGDNHKVTDELHPDCAWVLAGEGVATEKLDGTNVRLTVRKGKIVRVEKRRNPTKEQKAAGIKDPWYVDADEALPEDKWIYESVRGTDCSWWPDAEHCAEAIGPNIQGNPLRLEKNVCVPFNLNPPWYSEPSPRTYADLREAMLLKQLQSNFYLSIFPYVEGAPRVLAEGIVFHHPDGRRAKIKRKDF